MQKNDPVMAKLIAELKYPKPDKANSVFHDLVKAIIYQQIHIKAAAKIYNRLLEKLDLNLEDPKVILDLSFEDLKSVGLSRQKTGYIQNIAEFFSTKEIQNTNFEKLTDEEIISLLSQIKGVGTWTAEMILMFTLFRPDVLPVKDYAIQVAMKDLYKIKKEKKELFVAMDKVAKKWVPFRTMACLYLWQYIKSNR